MRRTIIAVFCGLILFSSIAGAAEIEIGDPLFVPIAYLSEKNRIMDAKHVVLGRIDSAGIVYDVFNNHLGFIEEDLTVLDVHHKTIVTIDMDGTMTDSAGVVVGSITDAKISDANGRPVIRYEGKVDQRQLLAYYFFFSGRFGK